MNAFRQAPAAPRCAAAPDVLVPANSIGEAPRNAEHSSTTRANQASSAWSADSKVTISRLRVPSPAELKNASR